MSAIPLPTTLARYAAVALPARVGGPAARGIVGASVRMRTLEAACHRWLVAYSLAILRVSVGFVFLAFGLLKFFPGVSPAQNLVETTTGILTLGLMPGGIALVVVASMETIIGLCLLSGRGMRGAIYLLLAQLVGILSPLVLLTGRLFDGAGGVAPTLEGQYVVKDLIIVGAALVLATTINGGRLTSDAPER